MSFFFFLNDPSTTEIFPLSLPDALPISSWTAGGPNSPVTSDRATPAAVRSEEHTSELQSLRHLVCRLLLEKIKNYCTASQAQAQTTRGASMDVEIDASLPKLKKHGRLHALRRISPLGLIRYERAQFEGDRVVIREVISRYLTAEVDAQKEQSGEIAVTPRNYKFKSKGMNQIAGPCHRRGS